MVIAVSLLVLLGLFAVACVAATILRRGLRWAWRSAPTPSRRSAPEQARSSSVPPFGLLPPLGPVGGLGGLSPDADIDSATMREHDLYGE